jgi:hypothetical protein
VAEIARVIIPSGRLISVEDWACDPVQEREHLADSLQRRRPLVTQNLEYHAREEEWQTWFSQAGLEVERLEHVLRPLDLNQFANLESPEAKAELDLLRKLWRHESPTTTMTMFICRKL